MSPGINLLFILEDKKKSAPSTHTRFWTTYDVISFQRHDTVNSNTTG